MNKKNILISSFDLAIGGVERSLIGLLSNIDYSKYNVDVMLYKHEGDFFSLLPKEPNLLNEIKAYTAFRKSIKQTLQDGNLPISVARLLSKYISTVHGNIIKSIEPGYLNIQYGWFLSKPFLPKLKHEYDVAISFLWPHYFVGEKVQAKRKIGWIHTDYSNISINQTLDEKMWRKMDRIIAVSDSCKDSFLKVFPTFNDSVQVIENMITAGLIHEQSNEKIAEKIIKKNGKTILATVGRLSHAKGIDNAVYACKELVEKGFEIEWYIIGYGPQEEEIKKLIQDLNLENRFFLLGKKTNPYPYIKACDIYVQPSRYEGKAVTVREAQILGKPVLITNFPTAKSQVVDGIDGVITEQGIDGIVKGISQLILDNELRCKLIENTSTTNYENKIEINKLYELIEK
jgi:glycosyltransferase involved in cell wall biosynthesis